MGHWLKIGRFSHQPHHSGQPRVQNGPLITMHTALKKTAASARTRYVPIKTAERQGVMALHRIRVGFKEERTACTNRIRGLLAEFGIDYVLIDCPPSLGLLTVNALVAAQRVLVPLQCEYYALEGISQLLNTVRLVQQNFNPDLAIEGGIEGEPVFGSLSVNARADLGSPFPRPLQDGDTLDVGTAQIAPHERALDTFDAPQTPIRVVMGPQDDEFGAACGDPKLFPSQALGECLSING